MVHSDLRTLRGTIVVRMGGFETKKSKQKKRGGVSLLSRVEVSELRLGWTADPPRPFQLRPVTQISAPGLQSRDFYSRLVYRRLSVFRFHRVAPVSSSVSGTCAPSTLRLFRLAPSECWIVCCRSCFQSESSKAEAFPTSRTSCRFYAAPVLSTC